MIGASLVAQMVKNLPAVQETQVQSLGQEDFPWIREWLPTPVGGGNGTPLQYSHLENPMDGGAWWYAIYGVAQSWTRLKRLSSSSSMMRGFLFSLGSVPQQDWTH